jgi:hypothetical protein
LRPPAGTKRATTAAKSKDGLTAEESRQLAEAMKRLTPEERKRVTKAVKGLSPEGRRQLVQAMKGQLATKGKPSQPFKRTR